LPQARGEAAEPKRCTGHGPRERLSWCKLTDAARAGDLIVRRSRGMARFWSLVLVLLPVAALAPAAPALKEKAAATPPIFGEWFRTGHTEAGTPVRVDNEQHHQVFTQEGQWQYWYGARPGNATSNSFVTDTKQNPPNHRPRHGRRSYPLPGHLQS